MATIYDVANYFLTKVDPDTGDSISNLKLQKLAYYAQAWHLAINDEKMFDAEFQAWAHGPVNYGLYTRHNEYGSGPIPYPDGFDIRILTQGEREFLDEIWSIYGKYSAGYLRNLTHQEEPWLEARDGLPEGAYCTTPIDEDLMKEFYGRFIEDGEE